MVQSNLVNTDAEGAIEGVYIKGVSAPGGYSGFQVTGMIRGFFGDIQNFCFYFSCYII